MKTATPGGLVARCEPFLFLAATLLLSGEIFGTTWLVTEDGPAHLYNAVIARELVFHPGEFFQSVFELNDSPVPNSLGHVLLSAFSAFLSLAKADKLLHLGIVFGLCFSFRFLVKGIQPGRSYYSWLIFPFVYSGIFYLGFYNFSLGVVLCLLTTGVWLRAETKPPRPGIITLLTVLCTLLFFSHLVPFLLFILLAGGRILFQLLRRERIPVFSNLLQLLFVLAPGLVLFVLYYHGRTETTHGFHWTDPLASLAHWWQLKHLCVHAMEQLLSAQALSIVLLLFVAVATMRFFLTREKQRAEEKQRFIFWGVAWLFVFVLVFAAPDDFGGSGAMTPRLIEISWLLLLLFLTSVKLPRQLVTALAFFCFSIAIIQVHIREETIARLNGEAKKVMRLSREIAPNSTGAYIPLTPDWLKLHAGELAFAEKKCLLLSNYETVHDFFLLKWNRAFGYNYSIGGLNGPDLWFASCYWPVREDKPACHVDYVLLCKEYVADSLHFSRFSDSLEKYYLLKKAEPPFFLYQSKQSLLAGK